MTTATVFVSSVQKELAEERRAVKAFVEGDPLQRRFFTVFLFADRLEVWNPGELPPSLTLADLRQPHASIPRNPLIAEPMFLAGYAERAGTGILDMIARCRNAGLPALGFRRRGGQFVQTLSRPRVEVTPQVTPEVRLIQVLIGEMTRRQIQRALGLKDDDHFREAFLQPALHADLVEMTIPDRPRSSRQKYRLTSKGESKRSEALTKLKPQKKHQSDDSLWTGSRKGKRRL